MNKIFLLIIAIFTLSVVQVSAQIGVYTENPDASSILDVTSPNNNSGVLLPRMTTAQKTAITQPAHSLLVYDTDLNCISQNIGSTSAPEWTCKTIFDRHFFYMPSINIPTSDGSGNKLAGAQTINLYNWYRDTFDSPKVKNNSAPLKIPIFTNDQLYYYITYHDPCITITGINNLGLMSYTVNTLPNYDSFVNIVFVVK